MQIACLESARGGQLVQRFELLISVYGYQDGDDLTGPQARRLAAALLDAADELDRITTG